MSFDMVLCSLIAQDKPVGFARKLLGNSIAFFREKKSLPT